MKPLALHSNRTGFGSDALVGPYVFANSFTTVSKAKADAKGNKNESTLENAIQHPNVITAAEALNSNCSLHLLPELVRKGNYDSLTARYTFRELVDALLYCHTNGVYHCNLRPESLLMSAGGTLKVTGFGSLPILHPLYSAPELAPGEQTQSDVVPQALDAWGVGVVLYWLLTSELPFADVQHATRCAIVYPSYLSADAVDLLLGLMDPNPDNRLDLASAASHPWTVRNQRKVRAPVLRRNVSQYDEHELGVVVAAAVPGRPAPVIDRIVRSLDRVDVGNGADLALLAQVFTNPKRLATWFEEKANLPTFTAIRLARFLYA